MLSSKIQVLGWQIGRGSQFQQSWERTELRLYWWCFTNKRKLLFYTSRRTHYPSFPVFSYGVHGLCCPRNTARKISYALLHNLKSHRVSRKPNAWCSLIHALIFFYKISFLQHNFLGEGCRAGSGFSNTDLEYVGKVLCSLFARFICLCSLLHLWGQPISWDLRWRWTVMWVGPWLFQSTNFFFPPQIKSLPVWYVWCQVFWLLIPYPGPLLSRNEEPVMF